MQTDSEREARIANAFVSPQSAVPGGPQANDLATFVRFLDRKVLSENAIISGVPLLHFMAGHARDDLVKELVRRGAPSTNTQQGLTPLHFAVSRDSSQCSPDDQVRRVTIIRVLVKEGRCQVNAQELRGWTALKFAVRFRLLPCVKELLVLGANADLQDREGFAPLHNAIGAAEPILKALLPCVRHVDALNHRKQTALIIALLNRDVESAELLLGHKSNPNVVDTEGNTPLILAARMGNTKLTQLLINHRADPNFSSSSGRTALHFAAESNFVDLAVWLVRHGADILIEDSQGLSPFNLCTPNLSPAFLEAAAAHAASEGKIPYIQRLISLGLDINATTGISGAPLLHRAAYCGHSDLVKFLLKSGAIGSLVDNEGDSAIHYVCLKDQAERTHVEALNLLLEQAANSSLQNKKGDTPLHIAARQGFNQRVHILLEKGADRSLINKRGELALHRACGNPDAQLTVCMLLDGADKDIVNKATEDGWTPLMYAAKAGAIDIAEFLVDNNADVNIKQRAGFTALHFAVQCTNAAVRLQLCELLLKQGASPNAPAGNGLLTPLHWACANALADVSALLVEHGGNIYQKDTEGDTSLSLIPAGSKKLAETLEELFKSSSKTPHKDHHRQASLPASGSQSSEKSSDQPPYSSQNSLNGSDSSSLASPTSSMEPSATPRRPPIPTPRRRKNVRSEGSAMPDDAIGKAALDKAAEAAAEAAPEPPASLLKEGQEADASPLETGPASRPTGLALKPFAGGYSQVNDSKPGLDESLYLVQPNEEEPSRSSISGDEQPEMLCLKAAELPKESSLGSGAYSDVYASTYRGEKVAVKLFKNLSMDEVVDVFDKEVRLLSRLKHRNVLRFIGFATEPGFYAIVTDLLERGSLYDILHARGLDLPWTRRLQMMLDAARGMEYLHSCQMLHRDLKSMNLLVSIDWTVKVADFGLTKVRMHTQTMASSLKGTPAYMAPELLDSKPISEATDVYAFGIILYEVATRKRPYHEHTLNAIQLMMFVLKGARPSLEPSDDIPEGLVDLAKRCWNDDFRVRPPFREICDWLQALNACVET